MKHIFIALLLGALGSASVKAGGEAPANFSAVWEMDMSRSESGAQEVPTGPMTVVITQQPDLIRIDTTANGRTKVVMYLPVGTKAPSGEEVSGIFRWEDSKLVTELRTHVNDRAVNITEVRTLDRGESEMIVDTILAIQHGYTGPEPLGVKSQNAPHMVKGRNVFLKIHAKK
jgi:hypothetical protein